jgi:hypothetical protein
MPPLLRHFLYAMRSATPTPPLFPALIRFIFASATGLPLTLPLSCRHAYLLYADIFMPAARRC